MNAGTDTRTLSLTVGTAGHIDHGKTELVKYLTGCNTDRLPEEQQRRMTIDLGFATCDLPGNCRVGIVDVPGHERFIHNMVAGASGIDIVVLVVAADDGVMPQTIEHFHIVRMLGVSSGMVVINKIDLVDTKRIAAVTEQVRTLVAGSFLEAAPIVPFSAKTGAGFSSFYDSFAATVAHAGERQSEGPFRLHIERIFILKGVGAVLSGIPSSGRVRVGDTLELLPEGQKKRVKGIQVYGRADKEGHAGECIALRLSDISTKSVRRGMVLTEPGFLVPSTFLNARFQLLPSVDSPLKPRTAIRLHLGTSDVPGHIILPTLHPLSPGDETYVQLQLKRSVMAAPGEFFVVRSLSPATTIGGGRVICSTATKIRRSKGRWIEECREREQAYRNAKTAVAYALRRTGCQSISLDRLARESFVTEQALGHHLNTLCNDGLAVLLSSRKAASADAVKAAAEAIIAQLHAMHDENPMSIGFPKRDLFARLSLDHALLSHALRDLLSKQVLLSNEAGLSVAGREPTLSPEKKSIADRISACYLDTGFQTPREDELPERLGIPSSVSASLTEHLIQRGILVRLSDNVLLHRDNLDASRTLLSQHLKKHGSLESGMFRDILKTTRKFCIPILEYWDAQGLTKRTGNKRVLKEDNP